MLRIELMAAEGNNPPDNPSPQPPNGGDRAVIRRAELENNPEYLISPEYGRQLVVEILKLESLPYEVKYMIEAGQIETISGDGRYLDRLYADLRKYVASISKNRNDKDPFDPNRALRERADRDARGQVQPDQPVAQQVSRQADEQRAQEGRNAERTPEPRVERGHARDLENLIRLLENPNTSGAQLEAMRTELNFYFKEARNYGLLSGIDTVLNQVYQDLRSGRITAAQVGEALKARGIDSAKDSAQALFIQLKMQQTHQNRISVDRLARVWDAYILWSRGLLELSASGQQLPEPRVGQEGEWRPSLELPDQQHRGEKYWKRSSYPGYYEILAENTEQLEIAKNTFLAMIKHKGLGLAPEKILPHLENFANTLGSRATELSDVPESGVTRKFAEELRQEFEGLSYIWGANYTNETYNPTSYNQFMTAMALHEGPQRWTRVARSGQGIVAVNTFKFDNDPRMVWFHNSSGSRGQLGNDTVAQHFLQQQIIEIMAEEGMGTILKDYDPRDINKIDRSVDLRRANLDKIGLHQSDDSFRNLYEGFEWDDINKNYRADAHIRNYQEQYRLAQQRIKDDSNTLLNLLTGEEYINTLTRMRQNLNVALAPLSEQQYQAMLRGLSKDMRESVELGRIQRLMNDLKAKLRPGGETLKGVDGKNMVEKLLYRLIEIGNIDKTEKDFYYKVYESSENNFDVSFQMIGVSGEKAKRGGTTFYVDKNIYIQAYEKLQHIDDKRLNPEQLRAKKIGRILWTLRTPGAILNSDDQQFYDQLTPQEKTDHIDHMPLYLAEKFVQFAENWTEMKYADDAEIWTRRVDLAIRSRTIPNFKACYRAAMMKEARIRAAAQVKRNGFQAKLEDAEYRGDYLEILEKNENAIKKNPKTAKLNTGTLRISNFHAMTIKEARGEIDPQTGKLREDTIQSVEVGVDFNKATNHWLSRWTSHTYWAYQQENRHMILTDEIFKQARAIRDGKLRAEDADNLAVHLLILDPTLCRVKRMPNDQMQQEITLMNAAVEGSNQGHQRINRNIHRLFLPVDGDTDKMRMGYGLEDYGGQSRFVIAIKALVASQPKRFARRLSALIAEMPMEVSSMSDIWGADGMMGATTMFADPIGGIAEQREASQFAITKFVDQMKYGWTMFEALCGSVDSQNAKHVEGLYMKPTNNSDKLEAFKQKGFDVLTFVERENDLFYAFLDSFGRLDRILKIMRVMLSDTRNAGGAFWIEDMDIFLPDGRFNPKLLKEDYRDTGTSRHSEKIFYDTFINWLLAKGPGGGVEAYPDDAGIYAWLENIIIVDDINKKKRTKRKVRDWLFDKMGL